LPVSSVAGATAIDFERGLDPAEAAARLAAEGPNELPAEKGSGAVAILLRQFKSPSCSGRPCSLSTSERAWRRS
jgi:magnesium-transporting ATPase (P-type)